MTDKNIAIRVRGLGKKYTLGGPQEQYHTHRDAIVNSVKAPFKIVPIRVRVPNFSGYFVPTTKMSE